MTPMTDLQIPSQSGAPGPMVRVAKRAKRLLGPTLGVFGLDSDGHLVSPPVVAGTGIAAEVREADEKDDHARLAIAEAELATERRERQQAESRPAPLKG